MKSRAALIAALASCWLPCGADAAPVTWPTNGHQYEAFHAPTGLSWAAAYDSCLARGGYLATLTSSAEHAFVYGLVSGRPELWYIDGFNNGIGPWLGGMQPTGSSEPGGGWRWVTDEPWSYTGWSPGEPNNSGPNGENRLSFFRLGGLIGDRWNDMPENVQIRGWVLEIPGTARQCTTSALNGHAYQVVPTPYRSTWGEASAGAAARGGHLVTIDSQAENDFVAALAGADPTWWQIDPAGNGQGPWIGGLQPPGSGEPSGGWGWVTGEPFTFTRWAAGEPNNLNGTEHWMQLHGKGALIGDVWNDMANSTAYGGLAYVVEYEEGPGCVQSVGVEPEVQGGLDLALAPPAPNPSRGMTLMQFTLASRGRVSLRVFGVRGELVRTLVDGNLPAGTHARTWDGRTSRGQIAVPGVYFVRLEMAGVLRSQRLVIVAR